MRRTVDKPVDASTVASADPDVHGGDLVFAGTRVPVATLLDHLKAGETIEAFLTGYPSVTRRQAEALLDLAIPGALAALGRSAAAPPRR